MENSVIVLDSSDDESNDGIYKKISKTTIRKTKVTIRSAINKHPLVPHAQKLSNKVQRKSSHIDTSSIKTKDSNKNMLSMAHVRSNSREETHSIGSSKPGEDNFITKIGSGELSIVPISLNAGVISTPSTSPTSPASTVTSMSLKRKQPLKDGTTEIKRIRPIKISEVVTLAVPKQSIGSGSVSPGSVSSNDEAEVITGDTDCGDVITVDLTKTKKPKEKTPLNTEFLQLIDVCREADSSVDMEKLINRKLIRYYETVHPDFVNSKSFRKTIQAAIAEIKQHPSLVYLKISSVLEELNTRRKSGQIVVSNEEVTSTGSARKDFQIKKLNRALYVLKKRIAKLDESEVDWDDEDNSIFMISERLKKRACEIYEKICDITGESKNAQRLVKKPIKFQETSFVEFNKTLQKFINETRTFPDMFDVLRCLEHCNLQNGYRLTKEECKKIAQDAFIKVGKLLQKRRKTDLYETVSYFTAASVDPATEDATLESKLTENQKYHKQINEIIDRYAQQQDKLNPTIECAERSDASHITKSSTINTDTSEPDVKHVDILIVNNNQDKGDGESLLLNNHSPALCDIEMDFIGKNVNNLLDTSLLSITSLDTELFATDNKQSEIVISSDEDDQDL